MSEIIKQIAVEIGERIHEQVVIPLIDKMAQMTVENARLKEAAEKSVKPSGFIESKAEGTDNFILKAYYGHDLSIGDKLYAAPPASVVSEEIVTKIAWDLIHLGMGMDNAKKDDKEYIHETVNYGINIVRNMLSKGVEK